MAKQETELKIYYNNMLASTSGTLVATSTDSTSLYSINNITNFKETDRWQASSSATQNIDFNTGSTVGTDADYITIQGHNLNTAGASLALQASSSTAFAGEQSTLFTGVSPTADTVYKNEFTSVGAKQYWRLAISGQTTAVNIAITSLGLKTGLGFINPPYSPHSQKNMVNRTITQSGFVSGSHKKYTERKVDIMLNNRTSATYKAIKTWFETHGSKNFHMAWNSTDDSTSIYLVYNANDSFNASINGDQLYDISLNLKGRKE